MNNFVFIDIQNLKLSIESLGWKLDYSKFRTYLYDKYHIQKAFVFIGYLSQNERLYESLRKKGYHLIFKPILQTDDGKIKGNVDAELVLYCMIEYQNFDRAMIVSGDGDFHCLIEYLEKNNKLLMIGIPNKYRYSALLKRFAAYRLFISDLKYLLEYKKRGSNGRSKP